jgi:hypothetical protein
VNSPFWWRNWNHKTTQPLLTYSVCPGAHRWHRGPSQRRWKRHRPSENVADVPGWAHQNSETSREHLQQNMTFLHVFTGFYILIPPQCESFQRCLMTLWYLDPPSTKNKWVKVRQETFFPGSEITHLKSCGCDGTSTLARPANQSTNQGQSAIPCIWFVLSICIYVYVYMCIRIYIYIYVYIYTYWYNMCI